MIPQMEGGGCCGGGAPRKKSVIGFELSAQLGAQIINSPPAAAAALWSSASRAAGPTIGANLYCAYRWPAGSGRGRRVWVAAGRRVGRMRRFGCARVRAAGARNEPRVPLSGLLAALDWLRRFRTGILNFTMQTTFDS